MEFEELIKSEKLVLCKLKEPVPIMYFNIFEEGDIWYKIKGCDNCASNGFRNCCGNCPMSTEKGCFLHLRGSGCQKPFNCVIVPTPDKTYSHCSLEFECLKGTRKGTVRKLKEPILWLL